jgi:NAD kinase
MAGMDGEKIILVTRKTRLEGLVERFNTRPQAKFYIEHSGGSFARYELEHETYRQAVKTIRQALERLAKLHVIERSFLPNFLFAEGDVVVTVGVDGLVVNTAKYLKGQPLIAVNPDPAHIDGVLLPFTVAQAPEAVRRALHGQARTRPISMAEAHLADGQTLLAFNDLFIGARSHVSARYHIQSGESSEHHSSSGIIISTGAGATGWLSSLFNMANGLAAAFASGSPHLIPPALEWESERLVYVVREPFASKTSQVGMVCGIITPEQPLLLQSEMPEGGVIFSDGVELDALAFNSGSAATIAISDRKTNLVVG